MKSKLFFLLLIFLPLFLLAEATAAQNPNRVGIVVDWGNGQMQNFCVEFTEEQISGFDALQRTGLALEVDVNGGLGAAVCSIGGTGCPGTNCFCECPGGSDCTFWSYWHLLNGDWQFSQGGAGSYQMSDGDVDGWVWGGGSPSSASPPVSTTFDQICPAVAPATETPIPPTATPLPPTSTAVPPTATIAPTNTLAPQIEFSAAAYTLQRGGCTELRWQVANVQAVYLNGAGVSGEARQSVCPTQTQSFELRVVTAAGEESRSLTVEVTDAPATAVLTPLPPTNTPAQVASAPQATTAVPTAVPTLQPSSTAALEVTVVPTNSPTSPSSPTVEIVMIEVPLADTATPAAVAVVATAAPTAVSSASVVQPPAAPPPFDWVGYSSFAVIVAILALSLIWIRRS